MWVPSWHNRLASQPPILPSAHFSKPLSFISCCQGKPKSSDSPSKILSKLHLSHTHAHSTSHLDPCLGLSATFHSACAFLAPLPCCTWPLVKASLLPRALSGGMKSPGPLHHHPHADPQLMSGTCKAYATTRVLWPGGVPPKGTWATPGDTAVR